MTILAFGLNHATAPLDLREKVVFGSDVVPDALDQLTHQNGVNEAAILSTCNRTEIYCSLEEARNEKPIHWLSEFHGLRQDQLSPFLYKHPDAQAGPQLATPEP